VLHWQKIEGLVSPTCDTSVPKSMSYQYLCRLEARIEGPADPSHAPLDAPLAQKECVVFSVMVSAPKDDGGVAEAIAFKSKSIDFFASPLDCPKTRIRVCGADVSLFDVCLGNTSGMTTLSNAPTHWKSFVQSYKAAHLSSQDIALKFEESALLIGTSITLVGEPQRGADGVISIVPRQVEYHDDTCNAGPVALSPKSGAAVPQIEATAILEVLGAKVLASDDAQLLHFWTPMKRRLRAHWKSLFSGQQSVIDQKPILTNAVMICKAPGMQLHEDSGLNALLVSEVNLPQAGSTPTPDPESGNAQGNELLAKMGDPPSLPLSIKEEHADALYLMTPVPAG
jgi:hypothetical protein